MPRTRSAPTIRPYPSGEGFYSYVYVHGKRQQVRFTERDEGEAFLDLVHRLGADAAYGRLRTMRAHEGLLKRGAGASLAELAHEFASTRPTPSTRQAYLGQARYLAEFDPTANLDAASLTVDDMTAFLEFLRSRPGRGGTPLAPSTVRMAWVLARSVLDRAVRQRLIPTNPAREVEDQPRQPRKRAEDLSARAIPEAEFRAIADRLPEDVRPLVEVLWNSGVRIGEALALRWQDIGPARRVDGVETVEVFVRHTITLESHTVATGLAKRWVLGPTKSKVARRVGMRAAALDGLTRGKPGEFLFTMSRDYYAHAWRVARAAAAAAGEAPAGVRLHDLRHSRVTYLLGLGKSAHLVAASVGHSSAAFTLDRYAHAMPSDLVALGAL